MFTGIIEEIGVIREVKKNSAGAEIVVECEKILNDVKIGDSIAINGTCQTVTKFDQQSFSVQSSPETLRCSNFADLKPGKKVNLERAMSPSSRFGGHLVYGHVDTTAKFLKKTCEGISDIYSFYLDDEISKYLIKKGSVCIDGISLTIADIEDKIFTVHIIPHTVENTTLKYLKNNDKVNIEADIIAKYVEQFTIGNKSERVTLDFLKENGF